VDHDRWLAAFNTVLAFTPWNLALRRLSGIAAGISNTMLLQISVPTGILLDERPGVPEIGGILLVSVGMCSRS
jgi:drug/metabolite transporter (DMT)-like permease